MLALVNLHSTVLLKTYLFYIHIINSGTFSTVVPYTSVWAHNVVGSLNCIYARNEHLSKCSYASSKDVPPFPTQILYLLTYY